MNQLLQQKTSEQETIINNQPKLLEVFEIGDVSHQGDLTIIRIKHLPKSAKKRTNRQLAEGNTQGSRHVLARGLIYDADKEELAKYIHDATGETVEMDFIGPVFVSPDVPTANDLTHPEHGHQGFPAGAICAIVYQRNWDQIQAVARRVVD